MSQLTNSQLVQYYRQVLLPEVEETGQLKLLAQHVLIVGVGGLGTHCAQQLSAAGIGHLHLMDDDVIEASNLPRQILFSPKDIGQTKVTAAQFQLSKLSGKLNVSTYLNLFTSETMQNLLQSNKILQMAIQQKQFTVLDCSDNMLTRQAVNAWCVSNKVPLISASISANDGQLLLIDPIKTPQQGCYRCIFTEQNTSNTCAEMGVLGPSVGVMASMQSLLALQHILNIAETTQPLHIFDGRNLSWRKLARHSDPNCPVCQKSTPIVTTNEEHKSC
ncbi:HesA/MoeB/ThiF family protein [Paraglaciecola sp. L3A3]|uniref:HesA/MoeB/ThiF family protein n=1 Tax=Paraglaciecola sp. L3A3 TaxID=2686358 RepID=UPI00131B55CF|nr:HesA/MoeB/ThiF family protein [Paraglaciecola sp. L3A3]